MKDKIKGILIFILGMIVSIIISVTASTIINSKDVFYDNTKTGLTANVNDALDEIYTRAGSLSSRISTLETSDFQSKIDGLNTKLNQIESSSKMVEYTKPFTSLPSGWTASAYKVNGIVMLTLKIPIGTSGWVTSSSFNLIDELRPKGFVGATFRYSTYADVGKQFLSLQSNGTLYGTFNTATVGEIYAQFVYPVSS